MLEVERLGVEEPRVGRWIPIAELMLEGKIVPFLGAGASGFHVKPYGPGDPACAPPSGRKLLEKIAAEAELEIACGNADCTQTLHNLAQVASYYARVAHSRRSLDSRLAQLTGNSCFYPNSLHKLLARVAAKKPLLVITTNYDRLLETAFEEAEVHYEVVATAADLLAYYGGEDDGDDSVPPLTSREGGKIYHRLGEVPDFAPIAPGSIRAELTERSLIYKIHGSVGAGPGWRGGYLIAEEDYVRFLGRMEQEYIFPHAIRNRLRKKVLLPSGEKALLHSLLFLGYSLADWNLRVLLDELGVGRGRVGEERHYAVLRGVDPVTKELLGKRNIKVSTEDLNVMVGELEKALEALGLP